VVIDTLARNAVGIDENSARDMGRVVSYADRLRERLGAAVLLVHHSRKNQEGRPVMRGSSALNGAADMVAQVDKDGDDDARLVLVCDKMKDGPPFQRASLLLQPVENSVVIADAPGKQKPVKQESLLGDDDFPSGV
jgi:RecA-family ATPase